MRADQQAEGHLVLLQLGTVHQANHIFLCSVFVGFVCSDLRNTLSSDVEVTNKFQQAGQFANSKCPKHEELRISVDCERCISLKTFIGGHIVQR